MSSTPNTPRTKVSGTADVLCDDSGRLGALSYLVPAEMEVFVGDAVEVPFGSRTSRGMVLGEGSSAKATKAILRVYGPRAAAGEIALAREIAARNFSTFQTIAGRLAPRTKRGNPPLRAGRVVLVKGDGFSELGRDVVATEQSRRLLACAPLVDQHRLAALEAALIAERGQVLVLCPTKESVAKVLAEFASGAGRMDTNPGEGEPSAWKSFLDGTLRVAVATRTAALWAAPSLVGIVVVDEDHPGHLEAVQPRTHARDVAAQRSARSGADLVLISSNPSPLALGAKVKVIAVGRDEHWPTMEIIERSLGDKNKAELPARLRQMLAEARSSGQVPVVVAPSAKALRKCRGCRATITCETCAGHSCTHLRNTACPRCSSEDTRVVGWDPERVSRLVGRPAKVILASALHNVENAGLVVLFDLDAYVNAAGLIPERWATAVLLGAAKAAGKGGRVVVMTSEPGSAPVEDLVRRRDLVRSAKRTWAAAKAAGLPPFGRLVSLSVASASAPRTVGWPGTVYGPRLVGKEYEILVRCDEKDLEELGKCIERLRRKAKVRVSVS